MRRTLKYLASTAWVLARVAVAVCLTGLVGPPDLMAETGPMILSLGDDAYVTWSELESRTGAVVRRERNDAPLSAFSVVVLSNIRYDRLPEAVRNGLVEYLERGVCRHSAGRAVAAKTVTG